MTTPTTVHRTHELGQSIWYDNISRALLRSGELARLVEQGVSGVTSNPSIFEKAIASAVDYDEALRTLALAGKSVPEIYEAMAVEDIRAACDVFRGVFDASRGVDGRISLEVLPELASDTERTVSEAVRLAALVGRPNVMIKVPATPEGIPAIRAITARGISVNATLIFSLSQYKAVAEAYLAGVEDLLAAGGDPAQVTSVASFFVSRVDSACDALLKKRAAAAPADAARAQALMGKLAIANSKLAYEHYQQLSASERWKRLHARGARPQRLLWASTGTKDPSYSDVVYIDSLIGSDTVNTVPPATLAAFLDHGRPGATLAADAAGAHRAVDELAALGVNLEAVCQGLLADGVKAFVNAMRTLLDAVAGRRAAILEEAAGRQLETLGADLRAAADGGIEALAGRKALPRLWDGDSRLFTPDTAHDKSIQTRLGWLRSPEAMRAHVGELEAFAAEVRAAGFKHVVLLGMGGSSLCPEVLARTFGVGAAGLPLEVLDNTDPAAVLDVEAKVSVEHTLFVVASKSGSTIEIQSFESHFWTRLLQAHGGDVAKAGAHFVAVTDPDTKLGALAAEKKYRRTFVNDPNIGGRFSALSYFGLVPAALLGADVAGIVESAMSLVDASRPLVPAAQSPALRLGGILGALYARGRDKMTLITSPEVAALGAWVEQLVAESTGKLGKGVVPVDLEPVGAPAVYGADRVFVHVRFGGGDAALDAKVDALAKAGQPVVRIAMPGVADLGREFYRWEVATAMAGALMDVNPFDEPNVTEAKQATGALLQQHAADGKLPPAPSSVAPDDVETLRRHLGALKAGDYLAFCAYFLTTPDRTEAFARMRAAVRDRTGNATTLGYGPRFLHSTGQLHKGGANNGVFIQVTADVAKDLPVPGQKYTFGTLRDAQALGDLQVLLKRGRRAIRVHLGADIDGGLRTLAQTIAKVMGT